MKTDREVTIEAPAALSPGAADRPAAWEQFDPATLFNANLTKMHHHQSVSQWIRTWSFALTGVVLGYGYVLRGSLALVLLAFASVELALVIILLKDVAWHQGFWRYRDRARACEAYLLGNIDGETMRHQYLQTSEPSRWTLLCDAFSPRKLVTVSTDFVESYLIIALAVILLTQILIGT